MSEVAVTYQGPKGAYHVEDTDGTWHELVRGVPKVVSRSLAERLTDLEDHTIALAEGPAEVPRPEKGAEKTATAPPKSTPAGSSPAIPNFGGKN